ncbi:hypothetical protein FZEAL_2806 [Fusarium zealandicum]|uniref:Ysc84 actin-binding domain-containing protein n=1 Tax=Fusarium zealandicum TaxID=1053134 RepID=A0A8H4UQP3_9HYPO|nr:hypothetical protein FZEAL_2806 [Fusarium zealandicum]
MSNPEKAPQYAPSGEQPTGGLLPAAEPGQQYPPPPAGPPPHLHQDSAAPPAYEQGQAELPGDEKRSAPLASQDIPGAHAGGYEAHQQPHFQAQPTGDQQQSFPPPPPHVAGGQHQQDFPPPPPLGHQDAYQQQQGAPHPNPLDAHPTIPAQQHQQTQQNYSIPQYNPANPVFAPPPTSEPANPQDVNAGHATAPGLATAAGLATSAGHSAAPGHSTAPGNFTSPEHSTASGYSTAPSVPNHTTAPGHSGVPGVSEHTTAPGHSITHEHSAVPGASTGPGYTSTPAHTEEHKKVGWGERFSQLGIKAAAPINSLAHKLGSQSFLPETLDKECDKAASILRTFCKKGVYADPKTNPVPTSTDPKATETNDSIIDPTKEKPKNRVIVTIPPKVIAKAAGLAIFTTLRAGFNLSGATGSGILIARLPDGSWGPPSGIQVHSVGAGFLVGLDIYDCVCVINSKEALAAFTNTRVGLGSDLAVVAGPYGAGGAVEFGTAMDTDRKSKGAKDHKDGQPTTDPLSQNPIQPTADDQKLKPEKDKKTNRRSLSAGNFKPVFSYVKSRGFYAGVQVDGTVVVERKDANTAFYGEKVPVERIIKGDVPPQGPNGMWPAGARGLLETLKGAEVGSLRVKEGTHPISPTSPTFGAHGTDPSMPVASGGLGQQPASGTGQLPAYVDDGVQRPGVGDVKYR